MDNTLKKSSQRFQNFLREHNLGLKVIEFKTLTRTSQEAADTIGCQVGQIAKTLIFKGATTGRPICVIASGANRVDETKVAQLLGEKIERADADFVRTHTGFAIGGVPPVGYELEIKPLIDQDLMTHQELWAAAGTPNASFKLAPIDLLTITKGQVVNIKK